jgi:hypothetical protein
MIVFESNITCQVSDFLNEKLRRMTSFETANQQLSDDFGIKHFFENDEEFEMLKETISEIHPIIGESDRAGYGDFQTNADLAEKVTLHLVSRNISPEIVIEPTCGKGNFIIASLQCFKEVKFVYGVEIFKPYVWETKFRIIDFFLDFPAINKPEILIIHCNVFDFNFNQIAKQHSSGNILILGNPPWVTNAKLGSILSTNLPPKTNFKNHSGLDAMTGKGNFDIAESITVKMIETFQIMEGNLLLLVKNSVIKNILFDQKNYHYQIGSIEKQSIDSKKEFNVSVGASLFYCKLNTDPEFVCQEFNFYDNRKFYQKFGWLNNKFVSNTDSYLSTKNIDGESPFVWRQGLKHDCSAIMELDKVNGHFINGLNEEATIEDGLVYGFLKSSDLKNTVISQTRKFTIVPQKKVGQDTNYIKTDFPQTYQYLSSHQSDFKARKSSIYKNKPLFSIFGIGDYSFKPFKVAISGLYKTFHFTLVLPQDDKPVMLDDTCYFIGFDKIENAVYSLMLLNSDTTKQFLQSVTFPDAKRTFTKEVLMRIDLLELANIIDIQYVINELSRVNELYGFSLTMDSWESFLQEMK